MDTVIKILGNEMYLVKNQEKVFMIPTISTCRMSYVMILKGAD